MIGPSNIKHNHTSKDHQQSQNQAKGSAGFVNESEYTQL